MEFCKIFSLFLLCVSAHTTHKVEKWKFYKGKGCKTFDYSKKEEVKSCASVYPCTDYFVYANGVTTWHSSDATCGDIPHKHNAFGGLDPHFRMLNGKFFSYHGECDLVLVSSSGFALGAGLDIHIRTKIKNNYSFIKALSMRIGNDTFEMEGKDNFHINGVFMDKPTSNFAGYPIEKIENATWCKDKCSIAQIYRIFFDSEKYIQLANRRGFHHVEINGLNIEDAKGLLGNQKYSGTVGRDGKLIENVNEYGQDWQVLGSDPQLFGVSRNPRHPHPCILPKATSRRRVAVSETIRRMAESACSYLSGQLYDICIFDVTATGDESLALSPLYN